ncbi:MAG: cardiolipin synthase ClsB, partial [Nitrosomonas sp.]|nr:cardiolipin synthase ClsB [Nitrosomonas sp.]
MKELDFVENNQIHLLCNGDEYFPRLETAIDDAQVEVHLETYIFEYDVVGRRIAEALMRAARRGVSVYLLVDGFGSQNLSRQIIHNLL